jgi:hypothetical protein
MANRGRDVARQRSLAVSLSDSWLSLAINGSEFINATVSKLLNKLLLSYCKHQAAAFRHAENDCDRHRSRESL